MLIEGRIHVPLKGIFKWKLTITMHSVLVWHTDAFVLYTNLASVRVAWTQESQFFLTAAEACEKQKEMYRALL